MKPRVCTVIPAVSTGKTLESLREILGLTDLIEIRLDYAEDPLNLKEIRKTTDAKLIATHRRKDQGGLYECSEETRLNTLLDACLAGFDYVDIAATTPRISDIVAEIQSQGIKVITSYHDFKNPLGSGELEEKYRQLHASGCDVVKITGWTNTVNDNQSYLKWNQRHPGNICFGMGEHGVVSRILAPLSGAAWTYASTGDENSVAPGQLSLGALNELYEALEVKL